MATKLIISKEKADSQISQTNEELDCLQENFTIAPYSLALLRQIMLLSTQHDFSLTSSLRATIVQVCNAGCHAFFTAHTNMDKILLACDNTQEHSEMITKCVIEGENSTITTMVPISLKSMRKTAKNCTKWSKDIFSKFHDTLNLLEKVHCLYHTAQMTNQEKLEEEEHQKTELAFEKEKIKKMAAHSNKMNETLIKLNTTEVKKLEKEDIKRLLKDGIERVAELEAHWKQLVRFFWKILNVTEVAMGKAIEDFANATESANLQGKIAEGASNSLKTFTKKKLLQFAFNAYSRFNGVSTVSKGYLKISDIYLMPSIIQLGTLVAIDAERNLEKISSMTEDIENRSQMTIDFVKEVVSSAKLANKNELKKRLLNINSVDHHQCNTKLAMATESIISHEKADSQISKTSEELDCLEENIIVAPHSLALLGQIMLLSTQRDFSLISNPGKQPLQGAENTTEEVGFLGRREDFKYITHPESFRATLVQVSNAGYHAFLAAHTNMDKIRLACANAQDHVDSIAGCVMEGEDSDITTMVPVSLKSMRKTAQECAEWSREICSRFHHTLNLLGEVHCSCHAAQMTNQQKLKELEHQKKEIAFEKEEAEKMGSLSNKIIEALIKVSTTDFKKCEIKGIKELLEDGIEKVAELERHWKRLVQFFEDISNVTEVMIGKAIENFANAAEKANLQGKVVEGSSNSLKTFTKKKLMQFAFDAYSRCNGVSTVSKSYLKISNTYLMPSVIQLGTLVAIDAEREPEKIKSMTKEIQCTSQMTIYFVKQVVINAKLENENEIKTKASEY